MHIILWDTRKNDVSKDFAGGFGVGMFPNRGGFRQRVIRRFYTRDYRPAALNYAYMAAVFKRLGHTVEYCEDRLPDGGDVYVFNPSLLTLPYEKRAMDQLLARRHPPRVLVTGQAAYAMPELFQRRAVTVVRGEPEQLLWKFDEVLDSDRPVVNVGGVKDLDELPWPDWSVFNWRRFRIRYDFWKFPTALIQLSRGCTFQCNYCPYILVENKTRFRDPEQVADEMRRGVERYGFRSFKFRDPLFGLDRKRALRLAECIGRLPRRVQFSIESRIDLLRTETLRELKRAGLTSITVGIETPAEETLKRYKRAVITDDRQREFVTRCRGMGIRTVAGFMIGFPDDTRRSIRQVVRYASQVNPTFANFNVVTPYPGTPFFREMKEQIASFDYTTYNVYTPVLKYKHLTIEEVAELHGWSFAHYYFRARYLRANAHLLWPVLQKFGLGKAKAAGERRAASTPTAPTASPGPPKTAPIPVEIPSPSARGRAA